MDAVPLAGPLVAVMVTVPGLTPVTTAVVSPPARGATVATAVLLLLHDTSRCRSRPSVSRTVAVRMTVSLAVTTAL
jgi:hypothetical protein